MLPDEVLAFFDAEHRNAAIDALAAGLPPLLPGVERRPHIDFMERFTLTLTEEEHESLTRGIGVGRLAVEPRSLGDK